MLRKVSALVHSGADGCKSQVRDVTTRLSEPEREAPNRGCGIIPTTRLSKPLLAIDTARPRETLELEHLEFDGRDPRACSS